MHYLWVFLVAGGQCVIYSIIIIRLVYRDSSLGPRNNLLGVARIMLLFPLIYLVTMYVQYFICAPDHQSIWLTEAYCHSLPLAIFRISSLAGHHLSINVELVAGGELSSLDKLKDFTDTHQLIPLPSSVQSVGNVQRDYIFRHASARLLFRLQFSTHTG